MKKRLASFIWSAVIWRKKNQITKCAINSVTLQKEEFNLVVTDYGFACEVLKTNPARQRFLDFRVWKQPFRVVVRTLKQRGWKEVSNDLPS